MPDVAALLRNALRNPLDDSARLVLADALQEQGDAERAEFVRLQVRDHSVGGEWEPDQAGIAVRALRLYKQHVQEWVGGYLTNRFWFAFDPDGDEESGGAKGKLERGAMLLSGEPAELEDALRELPPGAADWLECLEVGTWDNPDAIRSLLELPQARSVASLGVSWDEEPPLGCIDLLDRDSLSSLSLGWDGPGSDFLLRLAAAKNLRPHKLTLPSDEHDSRGLAAFLASPVLSELRDLELELGESHDALRLLAAAPHVRKLERLYISGDDFPASDLRTLFQSPAAGTVRDLSISGYSGNLHDVALSLAGRTALRQLRRLDLGFNELTTSDGEALARSQALESLTHLELSSGIITDGGLKAIVNSPLLGPMEHLDLSCTGITDAGLIALAQSPKMRNLRYLSVCRCGITARGVRAVAESPHLTQLQYLDLGLNTLEPNALDALASSTQLGNLQGLRLSQLTIDAKTLARLVDSPAMRRVEKLDMSDVALGPDHVRSLVNAKSLTSLQEFSLYGSKGRAGTITPLTAAPWLDQLVELNLSGVGLDDEGVRQLTRTLRSGNVGMLDVGDNPITSRGAELLLKWPGLAAVADLDVYGTKMADDWQQKLKAAVLRPRR